MGTLLIIDDNQNSTFYYYCSTGKKYILMRFLPETVTENKVYLSEQFTLLDKSEFMLWFAKEFNLPVKNYIVVTKENLLKIIMEELSQNGVITISNPSEFSQEGVDFKRGKQKVTFEELEIFFTCYPDSSERFTVFSRQEHVIRLYKQKILEKKNPISLVKKFNQLKKSIDTNLTFTGVTREVGELFKVGGKRLTKLDLPRNNFSETKAEILRLMTEQ